MNSVMNQPGQDYGMQLVVPLVLWGSSPPTHCISTILLTPDMSRLVTGSNDGQLCVWHVSPTYKIVPHLMMIGHKSAITALTMASNSNEHSMVISSSQTGEMCLWNVADGRCVQSTKLQQVHTNMQSHQLMHSRQLRVICNGFYPEILIINPLTLEILFTLCSRSQPDWISALSYLRPVNCEDDVLVAISNSGGVKIWTISGQEPSNKHPIYEDEAKQIRCLNAQTLTCCAYNQRSVLIVCTKYWQIYDASDFSLLCSESNRRGERWIGGEFVAIDKIVVWSNEGKGYLYLLPANVSLKDSPKSLRKGSNLPELYYVLSMASDECLPCSPAMSFFHGRRDAERKILLRGDSTGRISLWEIPCIDRGKMMLVRQESCERLPVGTPKETSSLKEAWANEQPEGLVDHLKPGDGDKLVVTCSVYVPLQGRLVCGWSNGVIIVVPAVQCVVRLLLQSKSHQENKIAHQVLQGHEGRVNCLLYPNKLSPRYEPDHLLSGGIDFKVILWDLACGAILHRFGGHGGEILQMVVPPESCNQRVLHSVCCIASDHSLSLLSLKERKCILLAGRQIFPIREVKWRPLDDYLVIGCTDGSVYIWQMETGHLDRVVSGVTADDVLLACDEKFEIAELPGDADPKISITQALRRHNLATFRNLAQQRFHNIQGNKNEEAVTTPHTSLMAKPQALPMTIEGIMANRKDPQSHIMLFDTESLIVQLLTEELSLLSTSVLEKYELLVSDVKDPLAAASESQKKIVGFFNKVKDRAEDVAHKIESKVEIAGLKPSSPKAPRRPPPPNSKGNQPPSEHDQLEMSATAEMARLLLSLTHAWGQDPDLDKLCLNKLALLCPNAPLTFGLPSRGDALSLMLPGWQKRISADLNYSKVHWQISSALTTNHLLSIIAIANTLMMMNSDAFQPNSQAQVAEGSQSAPKNQPGWSLLTALHCVLLPDLLGTDQYQAPLMSLLARKWMDRCLEIREATQSLLVAELRRIGISGRQKVANQWAAYLPHQVESRHSLLQEQVAKGAQPGKLDDPDCSMGVEPVNGKASYARELRLNQATAIVILGVLGSEFGQEMEFPKETVTVGQGKEKNEAIESFGIANAGHARHTCHALTFLLLSAPTRRLPPFCILRRAAIDLLGRGFPIWEPYLDISSILLRLFELCTDSEKLIPRKSFGLPLTPQADSCRAAKHALSLIASCRPAAFITTMAREVARYNALAQSSGQAHSMSSLSNSVLVKSRPEIFHLLELLVEKLPLDVVDHLVEMMDISVHCIQHNVLKNRGLQDTFPSICKFSMVSSCQQTKRVCVGTKNGTLAFYDLKQLKCQIFSSHKGQVLAASYSPDGKYLASFSDSDSHLCFWQTSSSSLFGLGSQQIRCVKTLPCSPLSMSPAVSVLKLVRLIWIDNHTVVLLTADGRETKFRI